MTISIFDFSELIHTPIKWVFPKDYFLQEQILMQKDKVIIFPWHIQQFLPYQVFLTLQFLLILQFHSTHIYWGPTIYWSFLCQGNINANKILNSQFLPQCFGIFPPPSTHGRAIKQSKNSIIEADYSSDSQWNSSGTFPLTLIYKDLQISTRCY